MGIGNVCVYVPALLLRANCGWMGVSDIECIKNTGNTIEREKQKNNKTTRYIPQLDLPEQDFGVASSIGCSVGLEIRAPVLNKKKQKLFFFLLNKEMI
jgi:hypothetical protein